MNDASVLKWATENTFFVQVAKKMNIEMFSCFSKRHYTKCNFTFILLHKQCLYKVALGYSNFWNLLMGISSQNKQSLEVV